MRTTAGPEVDQPHCMSCLLKLQKNISSGIGEKRPKFSKHTMFKLCCSNLVFLEFLAQKCAFLPKKHCLWNKTQRSGGNWPRWSMCMPDGPMVPNTIGQTIGQLSGNGQNYRADYRATIGHAPLGP